MKTVDKALSVLDQFSLNHTEIGLSELSRMAGLDKAATRRLLVALAKHGFIEQSAETRKYRLGHGFLRLARIREATMPIATAAQEVVDRLVELTNETVHVSLPGAQGMTTIAHRLPKRGHVITIEPAEVLYFHATSSGLAYLAFSDNDTVQAILSNTCVKVTPDTITAKPELMELIKTFRKQGYAQASNTFEEGVASVAMPFYQENARPTGAIAIAVPKNDLTDARREELLPVLRDGVAQLERALTGS